MLTRRFNILIIILKGIKVVNDKKTYAQADEALHKVAAFGYYPESLEADIALVDTSAIYVPMLRLPTVTALRSFWKSGIVKA